LPLIAVKAAIVQLECMRVRCASFLLALVASPAIAAPLPIIDVHLHADAYDEEGPPPVVLCAPYEHWPARDPAEPMDIYTQHTFKKPDCAHPLRSSSSDTSLRDRSLEALERHNVVAVTSGDADRVQDWWSHAPHRIIRAVG
jgi:hypothetical protein